MTQSVLFDGQALTLPSAASKIDTTGFESPTRSGLGKVFIVGHAEGGIPRTLKKYTRASDVRRDFYSGDLVDAAQILKKPSTDALVPGGAAEIWVYKTNLSTQSQYVLQNTSAALAAKFQLLNAGPYNFSAGDTLVFTSDVGGPHNVQIRGTAATVTASGAPGTPGAGTTLLIAMNGGVVKTVTFAGTESSLALVNAKINSVLDGGYADDSGGGALRITSTQYGSGSEIDITGGTALATLNLSVATTASAGPNDAVNLAETTAAELKARLEAVSGGDVELDITTSPPTVQSPTLGASSTLTIGASTPATANTNVGLTAGAYAGSASGAAVNVITLKSRDYGVHNEGIKVSLVDPAPTSSKRVMTIEHTLDGQSYRKVSPTLGDSIRMTVRYVGAAGTATMTVTATGITLTSSTAPESISLLFADYPTISRIVEVINATAVWTATAVTRDATTYLGTNLDWVTTVDVKTANYDAYSRVYDIVSWVNTNSEFVSATREATGSLVPDTLSASKRLTGASRGTSQSSDWTGGALQAVTNENCNSIIPLLASDNTTNGNNVLWDSVAAAYELHCRDKSSVSLNQRERRVFFGFKGNKAAILAKLETLNSEYASLCADRQTLPKGRANTLGVVDEWSTACIAAGMRASLEIGEPLTNKSFTSKGIARDWDIDAENELSDLVNAGLTATQLDPDDKQYKIVKGVTTYTKSTNNALQEESIFSGLLALSFDWRKNVERRYKGRKGTINNKTAVEAYTHTIFQLYGPRERGGVDFLIDSLDEQGSIVPGWRNIVVTIGADGDPSDVCRLKAEVFVVSGINFLLHTLVALPATIST